jgi:hypothetical protein
MSSLFLKLLLADTLSVWTHSTRQRVSNVSWTRGSIEEPTRVGFFFVYVLVTAHDTSLDGRRAKKAKSLAATMPGPSNNQELRRLLDESPPPPWFPEHQSAWDHAIRHVFAVDLKEQQSPRRFALPPLHLFWAPLNKIRGRITSIISFCGMSLSAAPQVISQASRLRNGGLF